jgi:outer membrane cobalamin receptor
VRYNIPSFGQSSLVWNVSGKYDFSSSLFFKATGGTAFRLPTDEELFANDPEDERGDPSLKPETSTFANLSLGGIAPLGVVPLKWELIGFYRDIKNLIDFQSFDAATEQDVFGNVPGSVIVRGAEITLSAPITADVAANFDNNAFNKTYYSALSYGVNDATANPYVVHDLGLRRTFSAYYTYIF